MAGTQAHPDEPTNDSASVIVAGRVYVDPARRAEFIAGTGAIVERAREHPGYLDLAFSPGPIDPGPIDPGRVNIFEHFESRLALDVWRADVSAPEPRVPLRRDEMPKHEVVRSGPPFG